MLSMLQADRIRFERARPLRAREYMRLVDAGVFDGESLELLGGVLVPMSPQGAWHAEITRRLGQLLILALHRRYWVRMHSGLETSTDSVPEPDVAVMPIGRPGLPVRWATLVVEVADDKGKSLLPPPAKKEEPGDHAEEAEPNAVDQQALHPLELLPPSPGAQKLVVLRGYRTISLPKDKMTVAFSPDPSRKPAPENEPLAGPLEGLVRKNGDYTVKIANEGETPAQLRSRHWIITDGEGRVEEVKGPGVVGQQPYLNPGDQFEYTSGCVLTTPRGEMRGTYQMHRPDGREFEATIAPFSLALPYSLN